MPSAPTSGSRALRILRYAAIAAGTGVGWLLFSSTPASAATSDAPPSPSLLGNLTNSVSSTLGSTTGHVTGIVSQVTGSAPVATLTAPVVSPSSTPAPAPAPVPVPVTTSGLTGTVNSVVTTTTGTVNSTVQTVVGVVPGVQSLAGSTLSSVTQTVGDGLQTVSTVTDQTLQGPLEPLAPVVKSLTSTVSQTVTSTGSSLDSTVTTLPVDQLTTPVSQISSGVAGLGSSTVSGIVTTPSDTTPGHLAPVGARGLVSPSSASDAEPTLKASMAEFPAGTPPALEYLPSWAVDPSLKGVAASGGSNPGSPVSERQEPIKDHGPFNATSGLSSSSGGQSGFGSVAAIAPASLEILAAEGSESGVRAVEFPPATASFDPGSTPD